ncbi:MAG: diacylglycerol kinase family protein [Chloroflexota bacterium]
MRAAIIYNPKAGTARAERQVEWAADALRHRGWTVDVKPTRRPPHMHELAAASAAEGMDAVFAAGGDGTVGAVADALGGTQTIMGVLPIGTENIWAAGLGLALRLNTATAVRACIEAQLNGTVRAVDMGVSGDRRFLLWAGIGLDAYVISKIEPRPDIAKRLGSVYFYVAGLLRAIDVRGGPMTVRTENGSMSGVKLLAVVANVQRYAGNNSVLDPDARVDDGLLDVWTMEGDSYFDGLAHLIRYKLGKHVGHPSMKKLRGREVEIELARPMYLQCDGELAHAVTHASFRVRPGDLRVFVPRRDRLEIFERG